MIIKKYTSNVFIIYLTSFVFSSLLFISLFHIPFPFLPVLFYRGVLLLFFVAILLSGIIVFLIKKNKIHFTYKDVIVLVSVFISFNLVFFTLVPVTVERSISVFMLSTLNKEKKLSKKELINKFEDIYLFEHDAIQKRLEEQDISGNVRRDNDKYFLTERGRMAVWLFHFISKLFNLNNEKPY